MYKSLIISVLAGLAAANLMDLQNREATCTKAADAPPCCVGPAGHTVTAYTDCEGCALTTAHNTMCDFVRCFPPTTDPGRTTTHTKCAPTPTPTITNVIRSAACTSTVTKIVPPCGDCGVTYEQTATVNVDCKGCVLTTRVVNQGGVGICVCPTNTALTVVTGCIASPTPY